MHLEILKQRIDAPGTGGTRKSMHLRILKTKFDAPGVDNTQKSMHQIRSGALTFRDLGIFCRQVHWFSGYARSGFWCKKRLLFIVKEILCALTLKLGFNTEINAQSIKKRIFPSFFSCSSKQPNRPQWRAPCWKRRGTWQPSRSAWRRKHHPLSSRNLRGLKGPGKEHAQPLRSLWRSRVEISASWRNLSFIHGKWLRPLVILSPWESWCPFNGQLHILCWKHRLSDARNPQVKECFSFPVDSITCVLNDMGDCFDFWVYGKKQLLLWWGNDVLEWPLIMGSYHTPPQHWGSCEYM